MPAPEGLPGFWSPQGIMADDIYRFADDLAFEIDDLLPIVDAAVAGLPSRLQKEMPRLHRRGRNMPILEILRQKELFFELLRRRMFWLLRQIVRAIEERPQACRRSFLPRRFGRTI